MCDNEVNFEKKTKTKKQKIPKLKTKCTCGVDLIIRETKKKESQLKK